MPSYQIGAEEDAQEYITELLDTMGNAGLTYELQQQFGVELASQRVCMSCNDTHIKKDTEFMLSLETEFGDYTSGNTCLSVNDCLKNFTNEETLNFQCEIEHCAVKSVGARKTLKISNFPKILMVQLKRFRLSTDGVQSKVTVPIQFEEFLDMHPYISHVNACHKVKYRLYAIITHLGQTLSGGHYKCYARGLRNTDFWWEFNDDQVDQCNLKHVLSQTKEVYMLFYANFEQQDRDMGTLFDGIVYHTSAIDQIQKYNIKDSTLFKKIMGIQITNGDMATLNPGNMLNDTIINVYLKMIAQRNENDSRFLPQVKVLDSFFYETLVNSGIDATRQFTRTLGSLSKCVLLIPVHLRVQSHWLLVTLDFRGIKFSLNIWDSSENRKNVNVIQRNIKQWLRTEASVDPDLAPVEEAALYRGPGVSRRIWSPPGVGVSPPTGPVKIN